MILNQILAEFFQRDLRQLINEVNQFEDESNLWKTTGTVKNSSGSLVLHILGGTNYLIGTVLGGTGYVRHRDEEFTRKNVPGNELVDQLEGLVVIVTKTLHSLSPDQMEAEYPIFFDRPKTTVAYVLTQLALHLNYHLGQVNYLRRILEGPENTIWSQSAP
jgi:hypothetical protein